MQGMKSALAGAGKAIRKPFRTASTDVFFDSARSPSAPGLRPMVHAVGLAGDQEAIRPKRLREAGNALPSVSRLVYRSGAVLAR